MTKRPKKEIKTLDRVLIALSVFLFCFITTTMVVYIVNGWQYDTLITMVLGGGGIECIVTAVIQIAKYKRGDNHDADIGSDIDC